MNAQAGGFLADPRLNRDALRALEKRWPDILHEGKLAGHQVNDDPFLTTDPTGLLCRFLIAEENDVEAAARRLQATIEWRREWRVLEYHRANEAHRLYVECQGAEMYFADSGHHDNLGHPFVVGRVHLCNSEAIHPWNHLRAGIFAIERLAIDILRRGCGHGSYLLDIRDVDAPGSVSGTGGGGQQLKESRNPHYRSGAAPTMPEGPLADFLGPLNSGMSLLRAALRIGGEHYPEFLDRVVFLRSNWLFSLAFRVFRLWVPWRSRGKFHFLGGWADPPMSDLLKWYPEDQLPKEFGGTTWALGGDAFIAKALHGYDGPAAAGVSRVASQGELLTAAPARAVSIGNEGSPSRQGGAAVGCFECCGWSTDARGWRRPGKTASAVAPRQPPPLQDWCDASPAWQHCPAAGSGFAQKARSPSRGCGVVDCLLCAGGVVAVLALALLVRHLLAWSATVLGSAAQTAARVAADSWVGAGWELAAGLVFFAPLPSAVLLGRVLAWQSDAG